jgi:hypothetical protein
MYSMFINGNKIFGGLQDLCPHPSSMFRGRAWCGPGLGRVNGPGRAGLKMLRYKVS